MSSNRNFSGSDAQMAETARTIHQQLLADLPTFSSFSSRFNEGYADGFLEKIKAADLVVTDTELVSRQVVKTDHVLNAMEQARLIYRRGKAYAELTFAEDQPIVIQEFSRGYMEARKNQPKMIVFLEILHKAIQRHQTALEDPNKGGMPASFANDITTVREKLLDKNVIQESFINTRKTLTEDRINTLNACYNQMIEINNFAQVVFVDSPARRSIYTFNPSSRSDNNQMFTGSVGPNEYKTVHLLPYQSETFISFVNKGTVPLLFDIATATAANDASALAGNILDLGGGALVTQSMQWLNSDLDEGANSKIIVHNPSTTETAFYEVNVNVG